MVRRPDSLAPLADKGGIIVVGRRAEFRQQLMQVAKMAGDLHGWSRDISPLQENNEPPGAARIFW
ncbi:hypothetical protein PDE01_44890 [Paracoccus denitrificans]|nr:hypothetical protein PDE01_44890 [Paracoccus denitrificans]